MHGELPGWGIAPWGLAKFGLLSRTGGPLVIYHYPAQNQLDVLEGTAIAVQFFDPTYNLNTATATITVNGVQVYQGGTGFSGGYVGKVSYAAGILSVQLRPATGFDFDKSVAVSAYVQDLTDLYTTDNWSFKIRANPICYAGLKPLPVEVALQAPFNTFISLEFYRKLFLDNTLRTQTQSINNRGNKSARALYHAAFSTELSTLQNAYALRDKEALATVVCEKQNTQGIDQALKANSKTLKADLLAFQELSGLDKSYLKSFYDYLDSTLYVYRVSLMANVLLYAAAYELAQG
jgi:hypothetical protein